MKKLLMVLLLVAAMVFVAACNRDSDNGANGGNGAADPPATGANGADTAVVTDEPVEDAQISGIHAPRDMGGAVITGAMWWVGGIVNAMPEDYYEEPDPATADNYFLSRLIWDNARRVEREFNVQFGSHVFGGAMDVIPSLTTSVMAGDPLAEVVFMEPWMMLSAIQGELIVPVSQINLPGSDLLGQQIYTETRATLSGDIWAFWHGGAHTGGSALGVNMDIINAIGAPNPQDLHNNGQWTWDAMLDIMRTATRDTTGDGNIDQWGIAGQPGTILRNFIGSNDGMLATDDLYFAFDHPNTLEALEFMETILSEGLWYTDPLGSPAPYDWGRNFFAFDLGVTAFFEAAHWAINDRSPLTFEFAIVPIPTGPSNYTGSTWLAGWRQGYTIPFGSDWAPADVLMIIEELMAWPGDEPELLDHGALNDARGTFLTEQCVTNMLLVSGQMRSDMGYNVPEYPWQLDRFIMDFLNQYRTPAQAVEAHRGPLQEMLDNFR